MLWISYGYLGGPRYLAVSVVWRLWLCMTSVGGLDDVTFVGHTCALFGLFVGGSA